MASLLQIFQPKIMCWVTTDCICSSLNRALLTHVRSRSVGLKLVVLPLEAEDLALTRLSGQAQ